MGRAAFIGFGVIAALFLIYEHTIHVLGILPYLLLLACPLMHVFMHHGHHHHGGGHDRAGPGSDAPHANSEQSDNKEWKEAGHT
jgi:hypothetical protein